MNKFVARKGLLSLDDTIVPSFSSVETTIQGGLSAEAAWNTHLNDAVVVSSATSEGKFLLINIEGQQYTVPLFTFSIGIGDMVIEGNPINQFKVA